MRVKGGTVRHRKHKKVLKTTKGFRMTKNRLYKVAHEAILHSKQYAYAHRQRRHSQMRRIWISRITAESRNNNITYRDFIYGLNSKGVIINKKILSEIAVNNPEIFSQLVGFVK